MVAGLLTVFSIEWNFGRFVVFSVVWLGFTIFVLMISSVRLAANLEDIYRQAALAISSGKGVYVLEKDLQKIADINKCKYLGHTNSAKVIRQFCFRKLPVPMMSVALRMVESLSVVTKLDTLVVTDLVVDVFKAFERLTVREYEHALERVHRSMREAPVSPEEFIHAFRESRSWIFNGKLSFELYLATLVMSFESGQPIGVLMSQVAENKRQLSTNS